MIKNSNYSNSAIKVFGILQKLLEKDCSKSELLEDFSDDSLLLYINTLKKVGFEITSPKSKYDEYGLLENWNFPNFNNADINLLTKIKSVLAQKSDYLSVLNFNNLLLIFSKYTTNKTKEKLNKIIAQKPFGLDLHEKLIYFQKCIENKTSLLITYKSPNSDKNYFEILPQAIKLENSKVYLLGYENQIIEKRCLRPEKIIATQEIINLKHKQWEKPFVVCEFDLKSQNFLEEDVDVELIENKKDKIIVKVSSWNNFELLQKILCYGDLCKVISPENFQEKIRKTIALIKENYDAKFK